MCFCLLSFYVILDFLFAKRGIFFPQNIVTVTIWYLSTFKSHLDPGKIEQGVNIALFWQIYSVWLEYYLPKQMWKDSDSSLEMFPVLSLCVSALMALTEHLLYIKTSPKSKVIF